MKVFNGKNVYESSLDRIRRIYDEFKNVYVAHSSGKDSAVVMELAIIVAREKGRLPVDVCFFDQEAEYEGTVKYFKKLKYRKEVNLHWFQIPYKLNNATTLDDKYLWMHCWDEKEKDKWMRQKEPDSIQYMDNAEDIDFYEGCNRMGDVIYNGEPFACLCGITAEESLTRYALMHKEKPVYSNIRWCSYQSSKRKDCYRFYPIYDWKQSDVWHAIGSNHWVYNEVYDKLFKMGVSRDRMRVSSLIHETGIHALKNLKEIEPQTFEKMSQRIGGINTYRLLNTENMFSVKKLPEMFSSWIEYRDYLFKNLISDSNKPIFEKQFKGRDTEELAKEDCKSILLNDICSTKNNNSRNSGKMMSKLEKFENDKR